jgi:hypothetical protein
MNMISVREGEGKGRKRVSNSKTAVTVGSEFGGR